MSAATVRKKRRGFVYHRPDQAAAKERWKRQVGPFGELVIEAMNGNPEPLREYFLDGPRALSEDDCRWLALLIERKLPRIGRPRGILTRKNQAVEYAHVLLREGKAKWCKANGRKRVSKTAPLERLTVFAIELTEERFPKLRGRISKEDLDDFKPPIGKWWQVNYDSIDDSDDIVKHLRRMSRLAHTI